MYLCHGQMTTDPTPARSCNRALVNQCHSRSTNLRHQGALVSYLDVSLVQRAASVVAPSVQARQHAARMEHHYHTTAHLSRHTTAAS